MVPQSLEPVPAPHLDVAQLGEDRGGRGQQGVELGRQHAEGDVGVLETWTSCR